jgi:hypothetical protein
MEMNFAAYLGLLSAAAWCAAYMRHLRETARAQQERLVPVLPYGTRIDVFLRLRTRYGMLPYALSLMLLLLGLHNLPWEMVLLACIAAYGVAMPLAYRFLTPRTGATHYLHIIRKAVFDRLREAQWSDEFDARLLRVALEHIK